MAKRITVVVSDTARKDLLEIAEYISSDSPRAGKKMIRQIHDRLKKLVYFPKSGRMIPEINDLSLREIVVGPYRLMYRVQENKVVVLRALHGKRLLPEEF